MATMTMAIPVPKQSKPKPYVDPLRVKPKDGSVKCDPKDPRFRFCYILHYLVWNTAERESIVEAMEDAPNDSMLVNLGRIVNDYTSHHDIVKEHHRGIVESMIIFWEKKSINLNMWTGPDILDIDDFHNKREALPLNQGGATYVIDIFEKCFEEAVAHELKGAYEYSGPWKHDGTLNPTLD